MYCEEKGMISSDDLVALDSGNPSYEVLRRVFYVAIPSLENIARQMGKKQGGKKGVFDLDVLREFYSGEHNERKMKEGQLVCLSFPARIADVDVSDVDNRSYQIELEPVKGSFWTDSNLDLKAGDWVVVHRADIVERIPEHFAMDMKRKLERLGLDKTYKFPKVAIKYLKELNKNMINKKTAKAKSISRQGRKKKTANTNCDSCQGRTYGNKQANKGTPDEGKGEAQTDKGGPKEAPDQGPGEAYA